MVHESFDCQEVRLTRTQQIILLTLANADVLSMSMLAKRINTSNEQATRAVSQLIEMGFMERFQNETNHRIVNIKLTSKGKDYLDNVIKCTAERFGRVNVDRQSAEVTRFAENLGILQQFFAE